MPSLAQSLREYARRTTRVKVVRADDATSTNLLRCLSTFDVTMLSIGHMVGSGVYVVTPTVAKTTAGPGIVLSFLISGIASFLAALCYAEFGVRYPRAGSAYSYTYLAVGELWAFLVGWNVTLEQTVLVASVSRASSSYVDSLFGYVIQNATDAWVGPIEGGFITLNFLSPCIVLAFVVFLSFGARLTSGLNNVFSAVNMSVIILVIGVGASYADVSHWTNPATGGFLPFGWDGVFAGAATCFYAYVGFDSIAASAEEALDPKRSIPVATIISMGLASAAYIGVGASLTLMVSYKDITSQAGFPDALRDKGVAWARYVVIVGSLCGMCTAVIGSLFAMTRVVYAMADDGLLFPLCARVNRRTKIPLQSLWLFGVLFSATLSFMLDLDVLTELLSVGTLFAYLVVSTSVIVIRYRAAEVQSRSDAQLTGEVESAVISGSQENPIERVTDNSQESALNRRLSDDINEVDDSSVIKEIETNNYPVADVAGRLRKRFAAVDGYLQWPPSRLVNFSISLFIIFTFSICILLKLGQAHFSRSDWWALLVLALLITAILFCLIIMMMHQQSTAEVDYKVPLVPILPALSIMINAWLICSLKITTILRLFVWIGIGLVIYFGYGIRHSKMNVKHEVLN